MEIYIKVSQEEAMNNKEKIGTTELTFLVMSICLALFPAFGTATVINYGKHRYYIRYNRKYNWSYTFIYDFIYNKIHYR